MSIDLERYPAEMRRLRRTASALLVPGVVLAAFGGFWLILVGLFFAFHEEMRASVVASDLDHPGLVRVVDLDATPAGLPFVVTEWLEGEADPSHVDAPQIAAALEALRGAGLVLSVEAAARVFLARPPGDEERPVLLHVGYLRSDRNPGQLRPKHQHVLAAPTASVRAVS